MIETFKRIVGKSVIVSALCAASAVPAVAASQSSGGGSSSDMPATKTQTQQLRHAPKSATQGMQSGTSSGETDNMPSTAAQTSQLKESKHMTHKKAMRSHKMKSQGDQSKM